MIEAQLPENEALRLQRLTELGILDTLEEQAYDDLTQLAAQICNAPIALVSLIDRERQWFKSHHGLDARETPRKFAYCSHAILQDEVFVVEDARKDRRFSDNPLATGEPHVIFYAGAPLMMENKVKVGTLCVIGHEPRTLTDNQKEALKALARQVVSQLELRLKIKALELLDHAKDEFISMVSHELRTPLTAIYGSLAMLKSQQVGCLNEKQSHLTDISYRNTDRLLNLVNDILDLAKLESGKMDIRLGTLDLVLLLRKAVELNEPYCRKCHAKITFVNADPKPVMVLGDEQRLLQVMSNLISNAAKFSFDNDCIEIRLQANATHATVSVTNHGPGIPLEQQKLLFTKFKQLHGDVNQKLPGTGLGLSICKKIMALQQGNIGFDSIPNDKTTFYFTLPRIPNNA